MRCLFPFSGSGRGGLGTSLGGGGPSDLAALSEQTSLRFFSPFPTSRIFLFVTTKSLNFNFGLRAHIHQLLQL